MNQRRIGPHDVAASVTDSVNTTEHTLAGWEKSIDGLYKLLADEKRHFFVVDEFRLAVESLGPDVYHTHSYYERWVLAIRDILIQKQVITSEELSQRVGEVLDREN
jgi:hypothetical protein